jgi:short-subunit dehydrogenase
MFGLSRFDALEDKVAIITGASRGIGAEVARQLAGQGAKLGLAARSADDLKRIANQCSERGGQAVAIPTDVTDESACEALIAQTVDAFGGLDILVNNAGMTMRARLDDIEDLSIFERIMQVNYLGTVYCTHRALPHLKESNGLIMGISSLTGKTGVPTRSAYAASKHAMQGFLDSIRVELDEAGVDVSVISPGFVDTDIRSHALGQDGATRGDAPEDTDRSMMSVEECGRRIVRAIRHREREVVMTLTGKLGQWAKLIAPGWVDAVSKRKVADD